MMTAEKMIIQGLAKVYRTIIPQNSTSPGHYNKKIHSNDVGNNLIAESIADDKPFLASRFGSVELNAVRNHLEIQTIKNSNWLNSLLMQIKGYRKKWTANTKMTLQINAGFFPINDENLERFSNYYLEAIQDIDLLGVWFKYEENVIQEQYCPNAQLIPLASMEPYYFSEPWSKNLSGMSVLIIHPFIDTIKDQLSKRENLFPVHNTLPDANYQFIRAVQSSAKVQTPFASWFDAMDHMKEQIQQIDFDVAIIGAGAYGLPLGSYVKSLGKKAIHMGGASQVLFGVKGNRWDTHHYISKLYKDNWQYPMAHETPNEADLVENACYWSK